MERRACVALVFLSLLSFIANAQDEILYLKTGNARLSKPSSEASSSPSSSPSSQQQDVLKQVLVSYTEGTQWAFRNTLVAGGVRVLGFAGARALLVYGRKGFIDSVTARFGALRADFAPALKITAEARMIARATSVAAQQRRRSVQEVGEDASDSGVLSNLETWSGYKSTRGGSSRSGGRGSGVQQDGEGGTSVGLPIGLPAANGPEQYGISVRLVSGGLGPDVIANITKVWPESLATALGRVGGGSSGSPAEQVPCQPQWVAEDLHLVTAVLQVYLCKEDIEPGMNWLSEQEEVVKVEALTVVTPSNAVSGWIMQTGNLTLSQYENPTSSAKPYWSSNIQGQGIIVGVNDDGLDLSHCQFLDDASRPDRLASGFVNGRLSMPNHRKVVQYVLPETAGVNWFGSSDISHGSHMVSSITGAKLNAAGGVVFDDATGAAPLARVSFFGMSNAPNRSARFTLPRPLDEKVLPYHYAVGARIDSSSWNRPASVYDSTAYSFDAFAWRNPDFLSIVAASNFGGSGMVSVAAPGTAKNVLTVGATVNYPKSTSSSHITYFRYRVSSGAVQEFAVWPKQGSSMADWLAALSNKEVPVRLANPENACGALSGNVTGSIVLVDLRDASCNNATASNKVRAAGALGVLFIMPDDRYPDLGSLPDVDGRILSGLVSRAQGLSMRSILRNVTITNEVLTSYIYDSSDSSTSTSSSRADYGIDSVLWFSGSGPLADNRIKPDIVAPGGPVLSASGGFLKGNASRLTCSDDAETIQGTSVSTAHVAGHIALMRQYFRDGFYPTGTPGQLASTPFEPSGMLLKAAAITGADSLAGGIAQGTGAVMGQAPDGFQGWGRFDLSGSLPLPGFTVPNFRASAADYGVIRDGEYIHIRGIKSTGTGPIFATLVWNDYPSLGLGIKDLVNDLEFGFLINPRTNSTIFNRTRASDNSNNVERVELRTLRPNDEVVFVVYGRSIRHGLLSGPDAQLPQRWALYVAGHFTGTLKTPLNPAFSRPQRLQDTRVNVWFNRTLCAVPVTSGGSAIGTSTNCVGNAAAVFTLTEDSAAGADSPPGAAVYSIRGSQNRCWGIASNATGTRIILANCNPANTYQKFAFFQNPYITNGTVLYQMVPVPFLGDPKWASDGDRRCMRLAGSSVTLQPSCNEDDIFQNFRIERAASVPTSPPRPPPPRLPVPAAQSPPEMWYPFPLTFRLDFFPINGTPNAFDYDYVGDSTPEEALQVLSDLDLVVSFSIDGVRYDVTVDNYLIFDTNNTAVMGAVHGGNNVFSGRMFEEVHFQMGYVPPLTTYHACAVWVSAETPQTRVKLTVFRGPAVAMTSKTFDTSRGYTAASTRCEPGMPGYVGSYTLTTDPAPPPSPPTPPAPPIPLPSNYNAALLFRVDWTPISGFTGRENQLVDNDIVIAWTDSSGASYELGYDYDGTGDGQYGGNNLDTKVNFETVFWPAGRQPPPVTYHVCIRWFDSKKAVVRATMSVFRAGTLVNMTTTTWDMRLQQVFLCAPGQNGFIGSYTYVPPPPLPPSPPTPPPAPRPPSPPGGPVDCASPSSIFSLYVRTQWSDSAGSGTLYDWDMVVAWSYAGQDYVITPNDRFVAGAVHSGDNMMLPAPSNQEAVYWPTGFTGVAPAPTTYHICVRWYQTGSLTVTSTVYFGTTIVSSAFASWSSNTFHSKRCRPGANGYIGSFNYTGSSNSSGNGVFGSGTGGPDWWSADGGGGFVARESAPTGGPSDDSASITSKNSDDNASSGISAVDENPAVKGELVQQAGGATEGGGSGGSNSGSNNNTGKMVAIAVGSAVGGALLAAAAVFATSRWKKSRRENTRVVAM